VHVFRLDPLENTVEQEVLRDHVNLQEDKEEDAEEGPQSRVDGSNVTEELQ
jgi:hypothetical protein